MSSTTQFTTFSDLYQGLLKATRTDGTNTATIEQAKRYINTAHSDMHVGFAENVPWAIRDYTANSRTMPSTTEIITSASPAIIIPSPINGQVAYDYGYANTSLDAQVIPAGTKVIVTNSADGTTKLVEGEVVSQGDVGADDPLIVRVYHDNSELFAVGDTVRFYQDDITMPDDFMRLAGNQVKIGSRDVDLEGRIDFRHAYAGRMDLGRPYAVTIIDSFGAVGLDNRKMRLFPIPNTSERIYITYVTKNLVLTDAGLRQPTMVNDDDQSIMPLRYRHAIFFHALYHWYRDRKDDTRSQEAKAEYVEIMTRIINDTEAGQSKMSIRPNTGAYRRKSKRPYRSRGGRRFDHGGFDRLE